MSWLLPRRTGSSGGRLGGGGGGAVHMVGAVNLAVPAVYLSGQSGEQFATIKISGVRKHQQWEQDYR